MLIAIMMGWGIAGILTASGVLTNDKSDNQYKARTDARSEIISKTPWFYLPYPGIIIFLDIHVLPSRYMDRLI